MWPIHSGALHLPFVFIKIPQTSPAFYGLWGLNDDKHTLKFIIYILSKSGNVYIFFLLFNTFY